MMSMENVIFGGGCFWCTEGVMNGLKGVLEVLPGYCGGHLENPTYEQVCGKKTGHAEVVKVPKHLCAKIPESVFLPKISEDESEKELGEEQEEGKQPVGGGESAMKSRKDVYSMTHGFVRGKSLEEWKSDEEEEEIFEEEESTKALKASTMMKIEVKHGRN